MSDPLPDPGARDEAWFSAFFRAEHPAVLAYARRRVDDADDVVAEVFATAWRRRDDMADPVRPWLLRTAHHFVLRSYRSQRRRGDLRLRVVSMWTSAPDETELVGDRHDAAALVADAMASLSPTDQEILRLTAWEQLDAPAIALVLGCSENAARVRLHRARKRLALLVARRTQDAVEPNADDRTSWSTP